MTSPRSSARRPRLRLRPNATPSTFWPPPAAEAAAPLSPPTGRGSALSATAQEAHDAHARQSIRSRGRPPDVSIPIAPVFPGDATEAPRRRRQRFGAREACATAGACWYSERADGIRLDLDRPLPAAMPAMGRSLGADPGTVDGPSRAISSASAWDSSCGGRSATVRAPAAGGDRAGAVRDRLGGLRAGGQRLGDDRLAGRPSGGRLGRRGAGPRDGADLFEGERAAQMLSTLMTVMAIAPLLGPIVGGQILALAGWRAIFWTLVGVGLQRWQRCSLPRRCRRSGATASRWRGRSPPMAGSFVSAGCSAMRAPAASSTAACSPILRARLSPTSSTTMSRRSSTACCSAHSRHHGSNLANARR